MRCHATALTECWRKFWICRQFADDFDERKKPNCYGLAIWLILVVIRVEPLNSDAVWWESTSYQPANWVTHLSITLFLQCSAQDCKSCNAKLQNLFPSPVFQTVKNAWIHDTWGHGFKSYYTFISPAIAIEFNFGNKSCLLPELRRVKMSLYIILEIILCVGVILPSLLHGFNKHISIIFPYDVIIKRWKIE